MPDLDLIPASVRRSLLWTLGDVGLERDTYSPTVTALNEAGDHCEAYEATRIFVCLSTKALPHVASVIAATFEWAHLKDVDVQQVGHAGTSGATAGQAPPAAVRVTISGSLSCQLPGVEERPPYSIGSPCSGWQLVPAIRKRAHEDEEDDTPDPASAARSIASEVGRTKQLMRASGPVCH